MFQMVPELSGQKKQSLTRLLDGLAGLTSVVCITHTVGLLTTFLTSSLSGPSCSKLTRLLVNVLLKLQMLISEISNFFVEKISV